MVFHSRASPRYHAPAILEIITTRFYYIAQHPVWHESQVLGQLYFMSASCCQAAKATLIIFLDW